MRLQRLNQPWPPRGRSEVSWRQFARSRGFKLPCGPFLSGILKSLYILYYCGLLFIDNCGPPSHARSFFPPLQSKRRPKLTFRGAMMKRRTLRDSRLHVPPSDPGVKFVLVHFVLQTLSWQLCAAFAPSCRPPK